MTIGPQVNAMQPAGWNPGVPYWLQQLNGWQNQQSGGGNQTPPPTHTQGPPMSSPGGSQGSPPGYYNPVDMPSGVGARNGETQKMSYDLLTHLLPLLQQQNAFGLEMEPQRQALLKQLLSYSQPSTLNSLGATYRAGQMGQATDAGQQLAGQLRSIGASSSTQAGALVNAKNQATRASNDYSANLSSIPNMMQLAQGGIGAINQNQQTNLQNLSGLASIIYGKPAPIQHGGGLLDTIGTIAGIASGTGFNFANLFGGGGGGGMAGVPGSLSGF